MRWNCLLAKDGLPLRVAAFVSLGGLVVAVMLLLAVPFFGMAADRAPLSVLAVLLLIVAAGTLALRRRGDPAIVVAAAIPSGMALAHFQALRLHRFTILGFIKSLCSRALDLGGGLASEYFSWLIVSGMLALLVFQVARGRRRIWLVLLAVLMVALCWPFELPSPDQLYL